MSVAAAENKTYKTSFINNRRYLGNKYKLLPFITKVVNDECSDIETVADIFAAAIENVYLDKPMSKLYD